MKKEQRLSCSSLFPINQYDWFISLRYILQALVISNWISQPHFSLLRFETTRAAKETPVSLGRQSPQNL